MDTKANTAALKKYRRTGILPPQAKLLLGIVRRYPTCFMRQEKLAEEMGLLSARSVRRWLDFLETLGLIICRRTNRTNRYTLPPAKADNSISSGPDSTVRSEPDNSVPSGPDSIVRSEPDTSLDVIINSEERNSLSGAHHPPKPNHAKPNEEPAVEANLKRLQALDALHPHVKAVIQSVVRQRYPISPVDGPDFRFACTALMEAWRTTGLFAFHGDFLRRAPALATADRADGATFVYDWFPALADLNPTPAELTQALEDWIDDPRRDEPRKKFGFAREAKKPIIAHLRSRRKLAAQVTSPPARDSPPAPPPTVPIAAPIQFGDCQPIADALRERIGVGRFDLWIAGKVRLERTERGIRIIAPNQAVRSLLTKFLAADFRAVTHGTVEFVAVALGKDTPHGN